MNQHPFIPFPVNMFVLNIHSNCRYCDSITFSKFLDALLGVILDDFLPINTLQRNIWALYLPFTQSTYELLRIVGVSIFDKTTLRELLKDEPVEYANGNDQQLKLEFEDWANYQNDTFENVNEL